MGTQLQTLTTPISWRPKSESIRIERQQRDWYDGSCSDDLDAATDMTYQLKNLSICFPISKNQIRRELDESRPRK